MKKLNLFIIFALFLNYSLIYSQDSLNVTLLNSFNFGNTSWSLDIVLKDSICYVANTNSGIQILNISDLNNIFIENTYDSLHWASKLFVKNNYLYFSDENGFGLLDITDLQNLRKKSYLINGAKDFIINNNLAFLACGNDGFKIVDISNPENIFQIASISSYQWFHSISYYHVANMVYASFSTSMGSRGIFIIDVNDPNNPVIVNQISTSDIVNDMLIKNDNIYLAERNNGLKIYDLTNPLNPILISFLGFPGNPRDFFVSNDFLYIASESGGIRIVNIEDPANPVEEGYYFSPNLLLIGVVTESHKVFCTNGQNGLVVFRTNLPTKINIDHTTLLKNFMLYANYPNPFNPETRITYQLPERGDVRLEIYNTLGQKVRTLVRGMQETGTHTVAWDGRDEAGQTAASGVYLYQLQAGKYRQTRKMVLMK